MSVTKFSMHQRRLVTVIAFMCALIGFFEYLHFPSQEDPQIESRVSVISAFNPGLAPEEMEHLIARPIEEHARKLPEVDEIESRVRQGSATVEITFHDWATDLDPIYQKLRNYMEEAQREFPKGTVGAFVNDDFGKVSSASIALTGEGFTHHELREMAEDIADDLYTVPGVRDVELFGVRDDRVYLEVESVQISSKGTSPKALFAPVIDQNQILPKGMLRGSGTQIIVDAAGHFEDLAQIEETPVGLSDDRGTAYFGDLVDVVPGYQDPASSYAWFSGTPTIVLSVSMADDENIIEFGARLKKKTAAIEHSLPIGCQLRFGIFQPDIVEVAISSFTNNLYQTLTIVCVVVLLFLGLRTGVVVGVSIPLVILITLIVMRQVGIPLHSISIAAMIISLGLLVDNSIVVAEDFRRRLGLGEGRREAAINAGNGLAVPLLSSSLTTIAAFMPLLLTDGSAGEYVGALSQVVTISLLASWMVAITFVPIQCYWFVKAPKPPKASPEGGPSDAEESAVMTAYLKILRWSLSHKMIVGFVVASMLATAVHGFTQLPQEQFPIGERSQYLAFIDLPAGSDIEETRAAMESINEWLGDKEANPDVDNWVSYAGTAGPRFYITLAPFDPVPYRGLIMVNTTPGVDPGIPMRRMADYLQSSRPEVRGEVKQLWLGSQEPGTVLVNFRGPDAKVLKELSIQARDIMNAVPGALFVKDDWRNLTPKFRVTLDPERVQRAGLSMGTVAKMLAIGVSGAEVSAMVEGDRSVPIVARLSPGERESPSRLEDLQIYSPKFERGIPLRQVADFSLEWHYPEIQRYQLRRQVQVSGKHQVKTADEFVEAILPEIEAIELPPGYEREIAGEVADREENNADLFSHIPICLTFMALLLIGQFNSLRRPAIIAITSPLVLIGAVLGMHVMGAKFSFTSMLGLMSLVGILLNNSIVMLDCIDDLRDNGANVHDAIVAACKQRMQPIVMTTLTTVLGLIPMIMFGGPMWYGMANAIAFGLTVGTGLTLIVVPILYRVMFPDRGDAPSAD